MPVPAPIVGLIAVEDDDLGAIEPLWHRLGANAALAGVRLCFVASRRACPAVRGELERLAAAGPQGWSLHEAEAREDPAGALAAVAAIHPGADVAWIDARALLPPAWDARLRKAAYAAEGIGVAVPLCDASPLHALLDPPAQGADSPDGGLVDRAAYCLGDRTYYEVPVPHAVCAYFRRDALDAAQPVPGEGLASLARRMRLLGFVCVVCDFLYVGCAGAAPEPLAVDAVERAAFLRNNPLRGLRRAAGDAVRRGLPAVSVPGLDSRPVQLHVMHYWGGGLDKWVRDFGRADASRTNLILASYRIGEDGGQRIVLYGDPDSLVPIRTWDIARPIRSTATASVEYRRILEQVVAEFEVETVIVSSLIWQSLDALALDVPTFLVCHDFYPICQAINPHFGKPCERCTSEDLRRCSAANPLNATFKDLSSAEWDTLRRRFVDLLLERRIEVVVPSPSVAQTFRRLEPRLREVPMRVIAHGIDLQAARLPAPPRAASEPIRLVVLGRYTELKGAKLMSEAAEALRPFAQVTLLGCGKAGMEAAQAHGWNAVEHYEPAELPELLRGIAPHAGLLASIVPETFSYTLSELFALGIPPVATALGSFCDRIEEGENGFLFAPDAGALVKAVRRLHREPGLLESVAGRLAAAPPHRTTAQMVRDYEPLLPQGERAVARFKVGASWQSGLTEPYRQLDEAYAELTGAYSHLTKAYAELTDAYAQKRAAYDQVRAELDGEPAQAGSSRVAGEQSEGNARMNDISQAFAWAEKLSPKLLKSPWWIGHIPFAFELIGRQRPRILVELGTYSGSSFAAFCQAAEACGAGTKCYGIDLWEGDIHMGSFDEELFREISGYMAANHPGTAVLVRKDFNAAVADFADGSIDFLHIDGTHTYEAVANDFRTWLPKMSERGVVLFHDINVTVDNVGEPARHFGVRRFFDETKGSYPHFEFDHCYGLGVMVVGANAAPEVLELVELSKSPGFRDYFAAKGGEVSKRFADMGVKLPVHAAYGAAVPLWRRAANKARRILRRALGAARAA
jgi:glycosyltransferase involved in cell wall biosynthesis/predicted O-methyltransferase YrrM